VPGGERQHAGDRPTADGELGVPRCRAVGRPYSFLHVRKRLRDRDEMIRGILPRNEADDEPQTPNADHDRRFRGLRSLIPLMFPALSIEIGKMGRSGMVR